MSTTVHFQIDDDVVAHFDDSADIMTAVAREAFVLELFRRAAVSGGRASKLLGLDRLAFMCLASSRGIPTIDMTAEEWQEEVRRVRSM